MMIKRRLAISNLLMIALPVLFTCIVTAICMGALVVTILFNGGSMDDDRESFEDTSEMISETIEQALSTDHGATAMDDLAPLLSQRHLSLRVYQEGKVIYEQGTLTDIDQQLFATAAALPSDGVVESNDRVVALHTLHIKGVATQCYIFGDEHATENGADYWEDVMMVVLAVMALAVLISVFLTNRFLIHFVFRRIEAPLDTLADGVREIAAGNLEYRIHYEGKDEFAPICNQFNEMAARLKTSVEEINRHEESRKELLAGLSHDLRTPLTAISAYVEGLLDGVADTPEKQTHYLRIIQTKANDIQHMVNQIFLYSKMDLDAFPVHLETVAIDAVLSELTEIVIPEYADKGLVITVDAPPSTTVFADPALLHRIMMNIVDNSLKYKTAEVGHLHLSFAEDAQGLALTFSDDGPGVPEDAASKLFDVFYRTDPSRHNPKQGSGLGLAIVAKAAERMNARLSACNVSPHGLAITLTLVKGDAPDGKDTDC